MKKGFSILMLMAFTIATFAQQAKPAPSAATGSKEAAAPNPNAPVMIFPEESFTFGEVPEGPQVTHEFKFTNTGKEPLVLSNVKASCGCTTPSWPKEPILPGKES